MTTTETPTLPSKLSTMTLCAALSDADNLKAVIEFMRTDRDVSAQLRQMNVVCRPEGDICKLLDRIDKLKTHSSGGTMYNQSSEASKIEEIEATKRVFETIGMNVPRTTKRKLFEGATVSQSHWSYDEERRYGSRNGLFRIPEPDFYTPDGKDMPFHTYNGGKRACEFGMRVCEALGIDTINDVRNIPEGHTFCVNWHMTAEEERDVDDDH